MCSFSILSISIVKICSLSYEWSIFVTNFVINLTIINPLKTQNIIN